MDGSPPFVLVPLDAGRYELRAFSDDTDDPIVLRLNEADGRSLGIAVGEMLAALDTPGAACLPIQLTVGGRRVTIAAAPEHGLRLTVER